MSCPLRAAGLGVIALLALGGCAATATLTTTRGTAEATILGGDEDALLVMNEAGAKRRVPREEVVEIDHPGNVLAIIFGIAGGLFAAEEISFAASGFCGTGPSGSGTGILPCALVSSLAIVSLGLFGYGLYAWISSRNAVFNPPPASDGPVSKYPLAFPDRDVPMPLPQGPPVPLVPPPPGL
jgi:hypothetical protein